MNLHPRNYLTAEQRRIVCVAFLLLLTGLAVKIWRTQQPSLRPAVGSLPVQQP